jgi:hypothetical protein
LCYDLLRLSLCSTDLSPRDKSFFSKSTPRCRSVPYSMWTVLLVTAHILWHEKIYSKSHALTVSHEIGNCCRRVSSSFGLKAQLKNDLIGTPRAQAHMRAYVTTALFLQCTGFVEFISKSAKVAQCFSQSLVTKRTPCRLSHLTLTVHWLCVVLFKRC